MAGKLGFFDSGIGGLTVMSSFEHLFPEFDMVYFGDRANCPYGGKTSEEIYKLVLSGVQFLVSQGAVVIILACNTAVSHAVWRLQNEVYTSDTGIKILGVTLPGAEKVSEAGFQSIGVLATVATVQSGAYRSRVKILSPEMRIQEVALPGLVDEIEKNPHLSYEYLETIFPDFQILFPSMPGQMGRVCINTSASNFIERITEGGFYTESAGSILLAGLGTLPKNIDAIVLGCTHYPLVSSEIAELLREIGFDTVEIIDPGKSAAEKFQTYLQRHPEFTITQSSTRQIFFSSNIT